MAKKRKRSDHERDAEDRAFQARLDYINAQIDRSFAARGETRPATAIEYMQQRYPNWPPA